MIRLHNGDHYLRDWHYLGKAREWVKGRPSSRRNSDNDLRALERRYQDYPDDINAYIAILAARRRAGIPVNQGVPPATGDVEAYAKLLEAMLDTNMITRPRVVMAAQLGHAAARLAAPEWVKLGEESFNNYESRRLAIDALPHRRDRVSFLCDCADRVLPLFEQATPGDMRPRLAIEAARAWVAMPSQYMANAARRAADAAVSACEDVIVGDDGNSASYSAYVAVTAADNVYREVFIDASVYAVFAVSHAIYEANVVSPATTALSELECNAERSWQRSRLAKYLLGEVFINEAD